MQVMINADVSIAHIIKSHNVSALSFIQVARLGF